MGAAIKTETERKSPFFFLSVNSWQLGMGLSERRWVLTSGMETSAPAKRVTEYQRNYRQRMRQNPDRYHQYLERRKLHDKRYREKLKQRLE
ncbi:hypothetical protein ACOMHN_022975 [Nucella lapillus]